METLSSNDVVGMMYVRMAQAKGLGWIEPISMYFDSDKETELYKWIGSVAGMRRLKDSRVMKGLSVNGFAITNQEYESSLQIAVRDMRRDKTGQIRVRINELIDRAHGHWTELLSELIQEGHQNACYDGSKFFSTDHKEGKNKTGQSNLIDVEISKFAANVHGSTVAPSAEEMQGAIMHGITQILGFEDNENHPMNETASDFLVMVPPPLLMAAQKSVASPVIGGDSNVVNSMKNMKITVASNTRLKSWTKSFSVFRTDGNVKPFIRQEEVPLEVSRLAEGSEMAITTFKHMYGVYASRAVGYGFWQHACKVTMK